MIQSTHHAITAQLRHALIGNFNTSTTRKPGYKRQATISQESLELLLQTILKLIDQVQRSRVA